MTADAELYVVPGDRHVERLAADGLRAETRTSLRTRLVASVLPDLVLAGPEECRLALAFALTDARTVTGRRGTRQMDLFAASAPVLDDPLLAAARARGGLSWTRLVASIDDAITRLRERGVTAVDVQRVASRSKGVAAGRAATIAYAIEALDERLARVGAVDERRTAELLANALHHRSPAEITRVTEGRRLRARWLFSWSRAELGWWRVLDEALSRIGGWARIQLPSFDRPLEGERERDPLETLAEQISSAVDAAPDTEVVAPVLGDLTGATPARPDPRVSVVVATDATGQARAAATSVASALARGASVENVAIAATMLDEGTLAPLRRALDSRGIVFHEMRGAPPSSTPVIVAAFAALEAADTLERHAVARLLRSPYIDPVALAGPTENHDPERTLAETALALEGVATASGDAPAERLVRTAVTAGGDEATARRLAEILTRAGGARTRTERIARARELWSTLGIPARAGRGGLATFARDEAPVGVARAERLAIARDARAWDAMTSALDLYERTAARLGAPDQPADLGTFRLELVELLDASAMRPGGGRAGAVRIARLADIAGEKLEHVVVVDANDGMLPRGDAHEALVSESFWSAIAQNSRGAVVAPVSGERRARELAALAVIAADADTVVLTLVREDAVGAPVAPSAVVEALVRAGVPLLTAPAEPTPPPDRHALFRSSREREREAFFLDPARPQSDVVGALTDLAPELVAILQTETGGGGRSLSVTGLERFAKCPFMGYAYVILAAREVELRQELPDAREEGILVHEALAAAFSATRAAWPRRPRDHATILRDGLSAADRVLDSAQGHAPLRAIARLRVRDAVRAVLESALTDDEWDFELAEQSFGMRSRRATEPWPALELRRRSPSGEVVLDLRGSVDRIDWKHDRTSLRVIDYKRSKTTVRDASSDLGNAAIQVPLYACVASRRFESPATGLYLPTQPRDIGTTPSPKSRARMDELVARLPGDPLSPIEHRALDLVAAARSGSLAPTPAHEAECRVCSVSGGCRKPRFAMAPTEDIEESG